MLRYLLCIVVSLIAIFSQPHALALDSETHTYFLETSQAYAAADKLLNDVWRELKRTLPDDEYDKLRTEQRLWLLKQRNKDVDGYRSGHSEAEAYAKAISARAEYLSRRYNLHSKADSDKLDDHINFSEKSVNLYR